VDSKGALDKSRLTKAILNECLPGILPATGIVEKRMTVRFALSASFAVAILLLPLGCGSGGNKSFVKLQGAGASFPAPLYNKWLKQFSNAHPDAQIDYQSVGSGQGFKSVIDRTVDFGASDAAMKAEEMAKVSAGVQLLPMTAGSVVLAFHLEVVETLRLSRQVYSGIFLGMITKWNDPAIIAANPGVKLPDQPINVVVRSDSSGTTFVFTKHMAEINPEFAKSIGVEKAPNWPVGTKSKGSDGEYCDDAGINRLYRIRLR
jgi:phosphate transport system substrate-binding protein